MKAKSSSRKADKALDGGDERDFTKHMDKSTYHSLKAGQKVHGVRDKDKFMNYYKKTYGEEVELDEAVDYDKMTTAELKAAAVAAIKRGDRNAVKAITAAANKKIANKGGTPVTKLTTDPKKLDALKKQLHGIKNEEVELDEAAPKIKADFVKTQREKDRAHDAAMGRTPTGRKKVMTSTQKSMASMRKEEVELDESITKMSHGRLKFHMNSGVPHGSYTKDEMKAERDRRLKTDPIGYRSAKAGLSEASPTKKEITRALQGMKVQPKEKVTVKKAPWEKNEEVNESSELDEAFKVGMIKLNDGGSVILKKEDVDVLNSLFKSLSSTNRKKMESTAMKDKNGFNEILSFAREAM